VVRGALKIPGLTVTGLMPNLKGAERGAALGVHKLNYVVSVSEGHNMSNVRRTTGESLADLKRIAEFLKTIEASKRRSCSADCARRSAAPSRAMCRMTAW
jgi:hydroxymethylglutaryl-CoA lyase